MIIYSNNIRNIYNYIFIYSNIIKILLNKKNTDYRLTIICINGGDKEIRTLDPLRARQVLSQLSYTPINGGPSGTRTPDLPVMSRLL